MRINRQSFIDAVVRALKAERNGEQVMNPGIGFYEQGDEITCRYESQLSPSERIHFDPWDAHSYGINDCIVDLTDDALITETAEAAFEIFEDEILDDLLDVLNEEY